MNWNQSPTTTLIGAALTDDASSIDRLFSRYWNVRQTTTALCDSLEPEDFVVQSMPDASPIKWHLAHTTWFFESFILRPYLKGYKPYHDNFNYLFNSYYDGVGERVPRHERGLMTRPTTPEVFSYRHHVDQGIAAILKNGSSTLPNTITSLIVTGINHEQQHQELILTDLKHAFSRNPLRPEYVPLSNDRLDQVASEEKELRWTAYQEGVREIGYDGTGFSFDNERPRHRQFVEPFRLASRLATNREWLEFMEDGGYERSECWLSDGWAARTREQWESPLYWDKRGNSWWQFTLSGMKPVNPAEPVCHVSYYEADAFARWFGARLPTEAEWETAADVAIEGNFLENRRFHPEPPPVQDSIEPTQLFGDLWEWTLDAYLPFPGFRPESGILGEYNGKFMCNQHVLRGGSCVTPRDHIRLTYRNFFHPWSRWQFSGVRLARNSH